MHRALKYQLVSELEPLQAIRKVKSFWFYIALKFSGNSFDMNAQKTGFEHAVGVICLAETFLIDFFSN